jgi:hypothetical protein
LKNLDFGQIGNKNRFNKNKLNSTFNQHTTRLLFALQECISAIKSNYTAFLLYEARHRKLKFNTVEKQKPLCG